MNNITPNEVIAESVASAMISEKIHSVKRVLFGTQNYVYAISTSSGEFILRMTTPDWLASYESSVKLQNLLLPLNIPLIKFLKYDINRNYSDFPSLLMKRAQGADLVHVYPCLSAAQKTSLADQVAIVHTKTKSLPFGQGFGFARFNEKPVYSTWASFFFGRLQWCISQLSENRNISKSLLIAGKSVIFDSISIFDIVEPEPFIWDMAERNVLVFNGNLSGIVDVDNLLFGDPLYTVALADAAFEKDGFDNIYTNRWLTYFLNDKNTQIRFHCYRLFWFISFLRGTGKVRSNGNTDPDKTQHLIQLVDNTINFLLKIKQIR